MADNPRLEELRRRVLADPASIAFAALAEEYRRMGSLAEAVETCRAGLDRHPSYLSARVTLGRALIELGEYAEARAELESVLKAAPENLAAIRAMAEIHNRSEHVHADDPVPQEPPATHQPEKAPVVAGVEAAPAPAPAPAVPPARVPLRVVTQPAEPAPEPAGETSSAETSSGDTSSADTVVLARLERLLDAIAAGRDTVAL